MLEMLLNSINVYYIYNSIYYIVSRFINNCIIGLHANMEYAHYFDSLIIIYMRKSEFRFLLYPNNNLIYILKLITIYNRYNIS